MGTERGVTAWTKLKPWLLGLLDLLLIGLVTSCKPAWVVLVLLGASYVGYRIYGGAKHALGGGASPRALPSDADYERRMHELEAEERELDAKIRALEA